MSVCLFFPSLCALAHVRACRRVAALLAQLGASAASAARSAWFAGDGGAAKPRGRSSFAAQFAPRNRIRPPRLERGPHMTPPQRFMCRLT
jgi:hypothetical protein